MNRSKLITLLLCFIFIISILSVSVSADIVDDNFEEIQSVIGGSISIKAQDITYTKDKSKMVRELIFLPDNEDNSIYAAVHFDPEEKKGGFAIVLKQKNTAPTRYKFYDTEDQGFSALHGNRDLNFFDLNVNSVIEVIDNFFITDNKRKEIFVSYEDILKKEKFINDLGAVDDGWKIAVSKALADQRKESLYSQRPAKINLEGRKEPSDIDALLDNYLSVTKNKYCFLDDVVSEKIDEKDELISMRSKVLDDPTIDAVVANNIVDAIDNAILFIDRTGSVPQIKEDKAFFRSSISEVGAVNYLAGTQNQNPVYYRASVNMEIGIALNGCSLELDFSCDQEQRSFSTGGLSSKKYYGFDECFELFTNDKLVESLSDAHSVEFSSEDALQKAEWLRLIPKGNSFGGFEFQGPPKSFSLVVDHSGSITENIAEKRNKGIQFLVNNLPFSMDSYSIDVFGSETVDHCPNDVELNDINCPPLPALDPLLINLEIFSSLSDFQQYVFDSGVLESGKGVGATWLFTHTLEGINSVDNNGVVVVFTDGWSDTTPIGYGSPEPGLMTLQNKVISECQNKNLSLYFLVFPDNIDKYMSQSSSFVHNAQNAGINFKQIIIRNEDDIKDTFGLVVEEFNRVRVKKGVVVEFDAQLLDEDAGMAVLESKTVTVSSQTLPSPITADIELSVQRKLVPDVDGTFYGELLIDNEDPSLAVPIIKENFEIMQVEMGLETTIVPFSDPRAENRTVGLVLDNSGSMESSTSSTATREDSLIAESTRFLQNEFIKDALITQFNDIYFSRDAGGSLIRNPSIASRNNPMKRIGDSIPKALALSPYLIGGSTPGFPALFTMQKEIEEFGSNVLTKLNTASISEDTQELTGLSSSQQNYLLSYLQKSNPELAALSSVKENLVDDQVMQMPSFVVLFSDGEFNLLHYYDSSSGTVKELTDADYHSMKDYFIINDIAVEFILVVPGGIDAMRSAPYSNINSYDRIKDMADSTGGSVQMFTDMNQLGTAFNNLLNRYIRQAIAMVPTPNVEAITLFLQRKDASGNIIASPIYKVNVYQKGDITVSGSDLETNTAVGVSASEDGGIVAVP